MQYKDKTIWLEYSEFIPAITNAENYRQMKQRGNLKASCTGGNGRTIYIEFDSLPKKYKELVIAQYGDPHKYISIQPIKALLIHDAAARQYFAGYQLPNGEPIPLNYQMKYGRQCDWLNVISRCMEDKRYVKETFNISIAQLWDNISLLINNDAEKHDLPTSVDRLRRKWNTYKTLGRDGLIEAWRFGNDFARKVTPKIEGLMLALYRIKYKPTLTEVHRYYNQFIKGEIIDLVDVHSAEVFSPEDFYTDGKAYELSESTIAYYLNTPKNKAVIDKERMSALEYNNTYRPHMMRKGPFYAFSKVTMDDTSSPFKMYNGDRPATYKMFDVASTALISTVMLDQKRPTVQLIRQLIMGVIGLIAKKGWKMPAEIEMERALTSEMAGDDINKDVLSAGAVFPYTRWCKAKNPQEKRAEGFIKQIKYQYQKHRDGFQYRPFAKRTSNKENADLKDELFSFQEIYQFEMEDMMLYNNALHPDQETYPGLTRWQVLEQYQNPNLPVLDMSLVMPYVGLKTKTSVSRMRVNVQYQKYHLPNVNLIGELSDPDVVAYYIPEEDGTVDSVFLYQDGKFLCEATKTERFQEAKVEQTADDLAIMGRQKAYGGAFDEMIDTQLGQLSHVAIMSKTQQKALNEPQNVPETVDKLTINEPKNSEYVQGYDQFFENENDLITSSETVKSRANSMF